MFNLTRLVFLAFISTVLLSACGDNNNQNHQKAALSTTVNSTSSAQPAGMQTVAAGTSEKDAIAKLGQPDLTQTRKIDALTVTYDEWHTNAGIIAAQFHNGIAKYSQFIPKNTK